MTSSRSTSPSRPRSARSAIIVPETLDPFDYMFVFKGVREGRRPDGQPYVDSVRSALRGVAFLEPEATAGSRSRRRRGRSSGISSDTDAGFLLQVGTEPSAEPQRLRLTYLGTGYQPDEAALAPGTGRARGREPDLEPRGSRDPPGFPGDEDALLHFDPYLTGKHLLTSQTFKSLFRSEVVGGAQGLAIRDIALLFTDIRGSTALYQRIGDLNAFQLVQQHFDLLRETTVRHGGAIVKTIGDAVMAAYPDAALAVGAALDMRGAIERFNEDQPERPVSLKIGIHHGAAIAVTLNDELDYFGQTVNIASRVQEMADAAEIWITEAVWRYPGVQALLEPYPAEPRTAEFHGIRGGGEALSHPRGMQPRRPHRDARGRARVRPDPGRPRNEADRRRRDYTEINPKGYVPALVLDDGQLLTENVAILSWVADRDPKLAPSGDLGRTRLIEMLAFIATELHKPFGRSFFPTSDAEKQAAEDTIRKRLDFLAGRLRATTCSAASSASPTPICT